MTSKTTNSSLTQKSNVKGEIYNFEIYNNKFMKVKKHNLLGEKNYHINLTMLEPWPVQHRHIAWRWLIAFIYCAITTNKPEKKVFSAFVDEIKARILAASQNVTFDKKQMAAFELEELRRLVDIGILSEQQYTQAKSRIMKMHL